MNKGALANLRVVDVSTVIAGSVASSMMADHGAEVYKVENPGTGDPQRNLEPKKGALSLWHKVAGRNKKTLTLKLSSPEGAEILKKLVAKTDILIENFRPGTMEKWGLSWEELKAINPKLVMVRISGFGQDGPYASRPGFGTIAESFAGLPIRTGFPSGPPTLSPFALSDDLAGLFAAFSAMFAVYNLDHGTGEGQVIDIGLHEPTFRIIEDQVIAYDQLGVIPERVGNRVPWAAPRGVFQSKDGKWISLSAVSDQPVRRLLTVVGGVELAEDPRFKTNALRLENVDELETYIRDWINARTEAEVLDIFERSDVVAGALYDVERIASDPQYVHRESIVTVDDPELGPTRVPGIIPKFMATPGHVEHLSTPLGHHNEEIYCDGLGISRDELKNLRETGVI